MNSHIQAPNGELQTGVVIPIGRKTSASPERRRSWASWLKFHWMRASAFALIGVPTIVTTILLGFVTSDRYAVEVKFAVRGQETPAIDVLGTLGLGGTGGNMAGDSYILVDYIRSRSMYEEVSSVIKLSEIYSLPSIDWFSRLPKDEKIERSVEYWRQMTRVNYEPATGIIRVEVSAYDPDQAVKISRAVTASAENLVNRLSTESRRDALKAATAEVERAEQRQRLLRDATRRFREKEQISDPIRSAGIQQDAIEKTRSELLKIDTELRATRAFMKDDAPTVIVLKNRRSALERQIEILQREIGESASTAGGTEKGGVVRRSIASMLSGYEEIEAERQFAEKAYLTSLASLERARLEADRKQRYLAIFEKAAMPDEARYPARLRGIAVVVVFAALIWGLLVLLVLGIREHT